MLLFSLHFLFLVLPGGSCNCERFVEHLRAKLGLVEANFTQTYNRVSREKEEIAKERDHLNLQAIGLRREKFMYEKEVEFCKQSCRTDFASSLNGISNVTKAFLMKIDSLFPSHIAFQLTCPRQREHLEQIRSNCTSLSREVEDKFQRYLDSVGAQMSTIHSENSRLKAENLRLSEEYRWCTQNRTAMIVKNKQNLEDLQQKHDRRMERILLEKQNLNGELTVLNNSVNYKNKEVEHLKEQLKQLEVTCKPKVSFYEAKKFSLFVVLCSIVFVSRPNWKNLVQYKRTNVDHYIRLITMKHPNSLLTGVTYRSPLFLRKKNTLI